MLIVLASLAGILLGLNFNVAVLLPAIVLGATTYAITEEQDAAPLTTAIVCLAVALQGGFILGLSGREAFAQFLTRLSIESKRV
ncbi:MAG: hypothetical protein Q7U92_10120 [Bradyrhizobium sp.]|nr:hypothetical protein [Bradyrhizobium sp.]